MDTHKNGLTKFRSYLFVDMKKVGKHKKSPSFKGLSRKRGFYNHNLLQFTNVFIPTEYQLLTQIKI